ncbi:MAG: bifunctional folylpolyglutamate synthase/dihydrofolate synthase [Ruminococcaceae bacterium]|nr:bifunctional folylpolyglutamate synthase/dihydrofolate synthase [Oscillospiraceae bacterium]
MNYAQATKIIEILREYGSRPGLDRVNKLLDKMGNPQDKLSFVHITGTNGKGSVCAVVSSVLKSSGYLTGLFTSPFITDLREQIQVQGEMISEEDFASVVAYVWGITEELISQGIIITEFEFTMAVAFEYFVRRGCEIVVLEVGMGGKGDSTNVIKAPLCAVFTPVSLDHTGVLGATLTDIAREKSGIIKEGTRVVSSVQDEEVIKVIEDTCRDKGVSLKIADTSQMQVVSESIEGTEVIYKGESLRLSMLGNHQVENLGVALTVIETLTEQGFDRINIESIRKGVKEAKNPARFEVVSVNPAVIIDGAHNPEGMRVFADTVKKLMPHKKGILMTGMLRDKDIDTSLGYIGDLFSSVYTVTIDNPRTMSAEEYAEKCRGVFDCVKACTDAESAFSEALAEATEKDTFLCVCGSLYLAAQIRPYILSKLKNRG